VCPERKYKRSTTLQELGFCLVVGPRDGSSIGSSLVLDVHNQEGLVFYYSELDPDRS
jgi:hypothetical protein